MGSFRAWESGQGGWAWKGLEGPGRVGRWAIIMIVIVIIIITIIMIIIIMNYPSKLVNGH